MDTNNKPASAIKRPSRIARLIVKALRVWRYCTEGVWSDTRQNWKVNTIKIANLSVRSFMNSELQTRAAALTYNTLLAIVPALALLFAIGRGFGFQNLLQSQLLSFFPSQHKALEAGLGFVDRYLAQASEGVFVGVGLVVLLWTMISLMSNIEETLNRVWGVKANRPFARKVIDYTAILFMLPILMICSSGISIFMSSTLLDNLHLGFLSPAMTVILDFAPFVLTWLSFTGMYALFPNTKVRFKNALICGIFAGTAFQILQVLFVSGQLYVSKYNAIYGSFAFLPLLLLWLYLTWVITLAGAVLCYSSQNIFQFNFSNDMSSISLDYKRKIAIVIMTIVVRRFEEQKPPLTVTNFAARYHMPSRITTDLVAEMVDAGLLSVVMHKSDEYAYQPAIDPAQLSLGFVLQKLNAEGSDDFIPDFNKEFASILQAVEHTFDESIKNASGILLKDLPIKLPNP